VIEINLLPGAKRKRGGAGFKLALPDFKALTGLFKDPWLVACVVAWLLVLAADLPMFLRTRTEWAELSARYASVRREERTYNSLIARRRQFERARDSLIVEVDVIRSVDRDRYIWPHLLDAVTKALPDFTWLNRLASVGGDADSLASTGFQLEGYTVDVQGYTRFLRNLEASPFIRAVEPGPTTLDILDGREVTSFRVSARYEEPDSSLLTLQPLGAALVQGVRSGGGRPR